jgi:hypothetical protein
MEDENAALMIWAHQAYEKVGADLRASNESGVAPTLLEVGGGPTIWQLLSASKHVGNITFTDHMQDNVAAVERWAADAPSAFDWSPYAAFVARLERQTGDDTATAQSLADRLKNNLHKYRTPPKDPSPPRVIIAPMPSIAQYAVTHDRCSLWLSHRVVQV